MQSVGIRTGTPVAGALTNASSIASPVRTGAQGYVLVQEIQ